MAKYEHTVTSEEQGLSVKKIIKEHFTFSRRFWTKMKFQNLIDLNGTPIPGYIIPKPGDLISIRLPEEKSCFTPEDIPIDVLYEDDDLLLINKQPGVTVHPTKGHPLHTIANGIMKYMEDTDQSFKIRFAIRLDMDTSGIVIIVKNSNAHNSISQQMQHKSVKKKYMAVVKGVIEDDDFTIDLPVGRPSLDSVARSVMYEGGKDAVTDVHVIRRFSSYTLVDLTLQTGRTHQLRVHLSHIGHPIVGDYLYGGDAPHLIERQALHAYYISFRHPLTGEPFEITCEPTDDIKKCIELISVNSGKK